MHSWRQQYWREPVSQQENQILSLVSWSQIIKTHSCKIIILKLMSSSKSESDGTNEFPKLSVQEKAKKETKQVTNSPLMSKLNLVWQKFLLHSKSGGAHLWSEWMTEKWELMNLCKFTFTQLCPIGAFQTLPGSQETRRAQLWESPGGNSSVAPSHLLHMELWHRGNTDRLLHRTVFKIPTHLQKLQCALLPFIILTN